VRRALTVLLAAVLVACGRDALACPSCFGQADGPLVESARTGMWVLLGLTLSLQGAFAAFFLCLRRRARQARAREQALDREWARLQAGWRTAREGGEA
jgi:hypothetical protein